MAAIIIAFYYLYTSIQVFYFTKVMFKMKDDPNFLKLIFIASIIVATIQFISIFKFVSIFAGNNTEKKDYVIITRRITSLIFDVFKIII